MRRRSLRAIVQRSRGHLRALVRDRQWADSGGRPHTPVGSGVGHDDSAGRLGGSEGDDGREPLPHRDVDEHSVKSTRHVANHYPTVLIEHLTSHRSHAYSSSGRARRLSARTTQWALRQRHGDVVSRPPPGAGRRARVRDRPVAGYDTWTTVRRGDHPTFKEQRESGVRGPGREREDAPRMRVKGGGPAAGEAQIRATRVATPGRGDRRISDALGAVAPTAFQDRENRT